MGKRKLNKSAANESPTKRRKCSQKYLDVYREMWPCLVPSRKGVHFVHCTVCVSDFSCLHAGRNDCRRHVESKQHKDYEHLKSKQKIITTFIPQVTIHQQQVTKAEVLMSQFICQSNLSLSTADTMTKLIKRMCPDSKIAQEMKCGRNKTTAILHDLARMTQSELADRMRSGPFTISTDGSNDDTSKQFPLVVRTIDPEKKTVNSELLSIPICNESATGENIFKLMEAELISRDIPWSNCIAFGSDNASVMTWNKKGVIAFMEKKQPSIYLSGCSLHLVHIAAKKAANCLPPVDDVLVDIFYYFNKSDKRKSEFKSMQELCDLDQRRMIKHVCTRWLSIGRPVVENDKENAVLEVLESVFSKYKSCLRTIKKPSKWKKKKGDGDIEDSLSEEEEKQKKEFKSMFVVGIQSVLKNLERDKLSAVLLWKDMQPAVLRKALLHLLHEHGCAAICLSDLLSSIQKSWPGLTSAACLGVLKSEVPNEFCDLIETVRKHAPPLTNLKKDKATIKPLTENKAISDIGLNKSVTNNEVADKNHESEVKMDTACVKLNSSYETGSKTMTPPVADPTKYYVYKSKADDTKSFAGQSFIAFDEGTRCKVHSVETVKGVRVKTRSTFISSKNQVNFGIRPSLIDLDKDQTFVSGNVPTCDNSDPRKDSIQSIDRKRKAVDNEADTNSEYKKINVKKFQKNMQKKKKKNKKGKKK